MYRIRIEDETNRYELTELAKMFVPETELDLFPNDECDFCVSLKGGDRNAQKRGLYSYLSEQTGKELDWGTLTGVKPLKLFGKYAKQLGDAQSAAEVLKDIYLVSDEKLQLLKCTFEVQKDMSFSDDPKAVGIYLGIPFCPTRCRYCSFTSNRYDRDAALRYLDALKKEIKAVREIMERKGQFAESIYIGGGTPTALEEDLFEDFVNEVSSAFLSPKTVEWTVECGRPDTITAAKLNALKKAGAGRISINPQTMSQKTLDLIGRKHSPSEICEAFGLAKECGLEHINADLIAGLEQETPEDFAVSLDRVLALGPDNITVHTLAVKRGSRLIEDDKDYSYKHAETVAEMLRIAKDKLFAAGYLPYYLYRQKHMTGNFENVGYAKPGCASIYNVRIMEENQTIIALGAGGISKVYYPEEDRIERVANVSNYEIYIDRIDEMIQRKEEGL